ncbi:MAG: transposase, partial [Chloroflexota bacterium]
MMTREAALAIYHAGPETVVRVLLAMDARIHALEQQVRELSVRLEVNEKQVKQLEDQLARNLRNSSKPPSSNGFNKPSPKSLREKSPRPSGGQPGHPGQTLAMVEQADQIQAHRVERCAGCGRALADRPPEGIERRQVHDLPPLRLIVSEHQAETKRCPCGHLNKALFPEGINAPVQYGPGVKAAAVYLKHYQFLPYERTCELLADLFACPMSEGTLANILGQCQERLAEPVRQIKEQIAQAPVAHFDESGSRVEKKLWWLHAA